MKKNDTSLPAIGSRISIMRQKRGLTQQDLADLLHVRRENISYWENGTRDLKTETIVLLAQKLNTTCDYLLGLSDVPSVDVDLKAVCDYTGLSERAVSFLQDNSSLCETIDLFFDSKNICYFFTVFKDLNHFNQELLRVEHEIEKYCDRVELMHELNGEYELSDYDREIIDLQHELSEKVDLMMFRLARSLQVIADEIKLERRIK